MDKKDTAKIDKRILRSKRDLSNALTKLLYEKSFDEITINEIAEEAMVSKNTFYNNFLDKSELLQYTFNQKFSQIALEFEKYIKNNAVLEKGNDLFKKGIHLVAKSLSDLKLKDILKKDTSKTVFFELNSFLVKTSNCILDQYKDKLKIDIPYEVISYFYTGAISSLLYNLALKDTKYSLNDIENYIYSLVFKKNSLAS